MEIKWWKNMKTGIDLITEERTKQIAKYNHTAYNDQCYKNGELLKAAKAYLLAVLEGDESGVESWPWHPDSFKHEGYISSLKKAGAFIAAELDRISLN